MTTFNAPTIWTPRSGPWWRLPRWADIAQYAKKLQFKNGKIAFKNGKPVFAEEGTPCCCEEKCDCVACPTGQGIDDYYTLPKYLVLTASGISFCQECAMWTVGSSFYTFNHHGGNPNTSYLLTRGTGAGGCCNYYLETDEFLDSQVRGTECSDTPGLSYVAVTVYVFQGTTIVVVRMLSGVSARAAQHNQHALWHQNEFSPPAVPIFVGESAEPCAKLATGEPIIISNTFQTPNTCQGTTRITGWGGTVTLQEALAP